VEIGTLDWDVMESFQHFVLSYWRTVTHGNLFLISKEGEVLTAENMESLKGKTIGVLKINEVPGLTLKAILNKYNIPFEEVKTV
jgi:ABC-type nitrate/sulfonate/bicarbonate transport system substrate-binding protein